MYLKIHAPQEHSSNKGSSKNLVEYLEKENIGIEEVGDQEYFFSHTEDNVSPYKVQDVLDHNNKGLKANDSKFFMLTVNPSEAELTHIGNDPSQLKDYTRDVMDQYAADMNRTVAGKAVTGDDLVYFAKLENNRIYKPEDKSMVKERYTLDKNGELNVVPFHGNTQDAFKHNQEIRKEVVATKSSSSLTEKAIDDKVENLTKGYFRNSEGTVMLPGNQRDGLQTHVHIIVSRQDVTQSTSMSPLANSRGSKNELNGNKVQIGFHREKFVDKAETIFDKKFAYERPLYESFQFRHGKIHDAEKYAKMLMSSKNPTLIAQKILNKALKDPVQRKILMAPKTPAALQQKLKQEAIKAIADVVKLNPAGLPIKVLEKTLGAVAKGIGKATGIGMG